jgi:hypothetical protein
MEWNVADLFRSARVGNLFSFSVNLIYCHYRGFTLQMLLNINKLRNFIYISFKFNY